MVTSRDRKSFGYNLNRAEKIPNFAQTTGIFDVFDPRSGISGPTSRRASACPNPHEWWTQPTQCPATDLAEIRRSSNISSWIWSIISGVVTVLGRPGRGTSQVEKSPRLNWATKFLTAAYDGACYSNVSVRMAWLSFGALPCKKKKNLWQIASPCWNGARSLTCFLSASVTRKNLQFGTWTDPSFQRHYRFRPTTSGSRWG